MLLCSHLCEVKIHKTQCEELKTHREAVEQPEGDGTQRVSRHTVSEIKGEEEDTQRCPQQTQEQKHRLITEALVSVSQHQPELSVHESKEQRVEAGVRHRQTQLDVRWHGRAEGGRRRQRIVPLLYGCLHGSPAGPGGGRLEGLQLSAQSREGVKEQTGGQKWEGGRGKQSEPHFLL